MRLGIALPVLGNSTHKYRELQTRLESARSNRFHGVELHIDDPRAMSAGKIARLLRASGLELAAIGTGMTYTKFGLSLLDDRKEIRAAAARRLREYIDLASELNCAVIIGLIRGRYSTRLGGHRAEDKLSQTLRGASRFADRAGVQLFLEPVNRYELNLIHTLSQGAKMLAEVGTKRMRILADTYHMNIEEESALQAVRSFGQQIGHVHLADCNRGAPGQGHIDFEAILDALKREKYRSWVSAEIIFKPSQAQAFRQTSKAIHPLL